MHKKIGVIGDVHAEDRLLRASLSWLEKQGVDAVICTGDIADGRGDIDAACDLLAENNVVTVAGNHDRWLLTDKARHVEYAHFKSSVRAATLDYIQSLKKIESISTLMGDLMLFHGVLDNDLAKVWPGSAKTEAKCSASLDTVLGQEEGGPRFIVNGHMHFRTLIDFEKCQLINAGTLKGTYPGVCIIDAEQGTLESFDFQSDQELVKAQDFSLNCRKTRRIWRNTEEFDCNWEPVTLHRRAVAATARA